MTEHRHRILLLKTGFRYGDRPAHFARARLYPDRIELWSWSRRGQTCRRIPLDLVQRVEWSGPEESTNAVLVLRHGERIPLHLQHLRRWHQTLENCLWWGGAEDRGARALPHTLDLPLKDLVAYTTSMS